MIPYSTQFEPPGIIIPITLAGVVQPRPRLEVSALVDTGSDITAVPESLAARLKLYPFGRLQLEDASAARKPVYTYEVNLALAGESQTQLEVVLTPFQFAILGRDWLANYYLLLDGPNQQFELSKKPFLLRKG